MPGKIENGGFRTEDGSTVHVQEGVVPGDIRGVKNDGVGFGPLRLTSWSDSTMVISNLTFEEAESDSWVPYLSSIGLVGAAELDRRTPDADDDPPPGSVEFPRRAVLGMAAGALLLTGKALGQSDEDLRFTVGTFDLERNPRGLMVDVDHGVTEYIDEDVEFFLSVGGTNVGSHLASEPGKTINPGIEGEVELESDAALSFVDELLARLTADDEVAFEWRPQETSFADETVGDEIMLTDEPVVVEAVEATEPSEVVVSMNGTLIPHADESGSAAQGEWYVRDGTALVYVVAEETPDTSLVNTRVNVGTLARLREKFL